jgi:hypothetical protein
MKTDIIDPIATRRFLLARPDRTRAPILLVVGKPYAVSAAESRCPIRIEGLDGQYPDICGCDSFQALCLALRFLKLRIDDQIAAGCRLMDPGEDAPYEPHDISAVSGSPQSSQRRCRPRRVRPRLGHGSGSSRVARFQRGAGGRALRSGIADDTVDE